MNTKEVIKIYAEGSMNADEAVEIYTDTSIDLDIRHALYQERIKEAGWKEMMLGALMTVGTMMPASDLQACKDGIKHAPTPEVAAEVVKNTVPSPELAEKILNTKVKDYVKGMSTDPNFSNFVQVANMFGRFSRSSASETKDYHSFHREFRNYSITIKIYPSEDGTYRMEFEHGRGQQHHHVNDLGDKLSVPEVQKLMHDYLTKYIPEKVRK